MQKHLFGNYLFKVTFWGVDGTVHTRTVKVMMNTDDENRAGNMAEQLGKIQSYTRRKVELLPPYTDPWER